MAPVNSNQKNLRKAIGALKDSTKVGIAKVNSEYKELDVAIVKATNHEEVLPKEKHVQTIFYSVSASSPRADVAYCLHALARRLTKTRTWTVALKTLAVIHRALREVDPSFREELINYNSSRVHLLNLAHFKDDSSPNAWDYSAWVRNYALYLEEFLVCFQILKYDIQKEHLRSKELDTPDLLEQLPALQELLFRLLACQPGGAARYSFLVQYALSIVAAESVRLYVTITDGIVNLVDKFFEMQRHDAVRALEIYRKAGNQAEKLSEFFEMCRSVDFGRAQKYIKIEQPPSSFMAAMEEYVKDAPQSLMLPWSAHEDDKISGPHAITATKTILDVDHELGTDTKQSSDPSVSSPDDAESKKSETAVAPIIDLLGLYDISQEVSEVDDSNGLALAIITPENQTNAASSPDLMSQSSSWELALVTTPSSNQGAIAGSTPGGGLDRLTLDSLYDVAMAAAKANLDGSYHTGETTTTNPFEAADYNEEQFYASSSIQQPDNIEMDAMAQQEEGFMQQQEQFMVGHESTNPFGNPFVEQDTLSYLPQNQSSHPNLI